MLHHILLYFILAQSGNILAQVLHKCFIFCFILSYFILLQMGERL